MVAADARASRLPRTLLVIVAMLTLFAGGLHAQEVTGNDFDDPTDYSYSPLNVMRWGCIDAIGAAVGDVFHADCWGDPSAEDAKRINAKSTDRWLRGGLLALTQLWQGVQYVKDIVQAGKNTVAQVKSLVAGFGDEDPHMTVYRMKWATDRFDRRLDQAGMLAKSRELPIPDSRYLKIDAAVGRSLATAKEGEEAAIETVDRAAAMRARLSNAELTTMGLGYDAAGANPRARPPLPHDAPASADAYYAGMPSLGSGGSGEGAAAGSGSGGSGEGAGGTGEGVGGSGEDAACAIPSGEGVDPAVMYQRATVMARGAQTTLLAAQSDLERQRGLIKTIAAREKEHERQQRWNAMYWSVTIY